MLYTRFVIGDETLSSTSAFNFCHCAIFSTAIKSFILGPVVGHYRPSGHYLRTMNDIKQIGALFTACALPRGSLSLSLDISHSRRQFAGRTELANFPLSERSCGHDECGLWVDGLDSASRSRVDALADDRVPFQVP